MAHIVQPTTSVLAAMSSNDALSSNLHLRKFTFAVPAFKDTEDWHTFLSTPMYQGKRGSKGEDYINCSC